MTVPAPRRPDDSGPAASTVYRPARPVDVPATLSSLRRGRGDPTFAAVGGAVWRTAWTPEGPGTLRVEPRAGGEVHAAAWGPGASWLVEGVPELLGSRDPWETFAPSHPLLAELHRRLPGLRVPRARLVLEMLVPCVLEQKVTGKEARRSFRYLVRRFGAPAPGPAPEGMLVCPPASVWRRVPSWDWHAAGVDPKRARTVLAACAVAPALERSLGLDPWEAVAGLLRGVPGVGAWTAAEVAQRAHGLADAVSVGDYHLPSVVGWALAGRPVDDDGMLALLDGDRPHRHRCIRLLELAGPRPPRFGPRATITDHRSR